jgi:hypothetical protein
VLALPSFVDRSHGWVAVLTSSDTYQAHTFLFRTIDGGASVRLREPPTFETSRDGSRHLVGGDPGR